MTPSSSAAISAASTAAPRRMRAPDRLPSRSAATTNGAVASGSSSATHAPVPLRSWNWPGRRRPARRSGNPTSSAAPASSGSTASVSKRTPARRAMSAARSRTRSTARRSARSSRTWPHTSATRSARSAGSRSLRPRMTSRSSTTAATTHDRRPAAPATMRASRGWTGSPTIARPSGVMTPAASTRAELAQQLDGLLPRPCAAAGRRTTAARPACPTRPARARTRPGRPG